MAKWFGAVGYAVPTEITPGVWKDVIEEHEYCGDISRNLDRLQSAEQLNDNVKLENEISIVADPFAVKNFYAIRYVIYEGIKLKISSVQVSYPRLILSLGGVYNG